MDILINTTPMNHIGGVSNHYKGLKNYWSENIHYNYIGGRYRIPGFIIIMFDFFKFIYKCLKIDPDIVLLNPSLGKTALLRDGLFLKISKVLGKKTIVFIHGWDVEQEGRISKNPNSFVRKFNQADAFVILASEFRNIMLRWGITTPIYITTTKVDDKLVESFKIKKKEYNQTLLFLARVETEKGIFITLRAYQEINKKYSSTKLVVAGSGTALSDAKKFVETEKISNVRFTGFISGSELIEIFENSAIYLLPTNHGEGMPTSILEAMAFGLNIITCPVGGIIDFFENGKMGFLINSLDYSEYSKAVGELLSDKKKMKLIGEYNYNYAKKHFMASKVASSLEDIFRKVLAQ